MHEYQRYPIVAVFALLLGALLLRLALRARITLQNSLVFLLFLGGMAALAADPRVTASFAAKLGFALPSNFLFAATIVALVLLHVTTLVTLSRVELRSIALTQELALLRERLERVSLPPSHEPATKDDRAEP
jgi:hypothetical protein